MRFNFSSLIDGCSPQQVNCIIQQWSRLKGFLDQEKAFQLLQRLKQQKNLQFLEMLSNQDILENFSVKQSQKPQKGAKGQQNIKKQKEPKEVIHKKQSDRLETQLKYCIQKFRPYHKFNKSFQQKIIQFFNNFKAKTQILSQSLIQEEVLKLKGKYVNFQNIYYYLQLVDSALYYTTPKHRLRQTQVIALFIFLLGGCPKILLEILTGEGKSTTVSCLAAILAISGKEVDIVTTSELLAKRDVQEKRSFYKLLGLEVDHNFVQNQKNEKKCYQNQKIVYGTPHSFQVDILFDQYKKRGTRCKRPFTVLIVDEVDSMFIDQKDHQTLLASTFPGFSELVHPMKIIWNKINCNPIFRENQEMKMALAVGKNETVSARIKDVMNEVIKQIREKYKNEIIPQWRMQFIQLSLQKWIESAIHAAFIYKEKKQYVVRNGKIIPVDYKNNGALQEGVHWENGLHQFLQIKHGIPVTTQGMTSNFISNLGHFDKYRQLYGLTGTLGSDNAKKFLQQTYKADLMKIPPFKERRLEIQPGAVLQDETQWANYICTRVHQMLICQRSVLILCESIAQANRINKALHINKISAKRLQNLLTGSQKIDDSIDCEEIVIATNLAGRGADFKITNKLNERGGLHVIITFMPINSRVQMQGRGRAGRNGCQGSSEIAVNHKKHCEELGLNEQVKRMIQVQGFERSQLFTSLRDTQQASNMARDQQRVYNLRCKDKIFNIYCQGVNKIPDFQKNNAKQQALEEAFAMFLKRADILKIPYDDLVNQATNLVREFQLKSDKFYNPNHLVGRGVNYLRQGKNNEAIQMFDKAEKDSIGSIPQIIGGLYSNCCKLNQNKENSQTIKNCLKNLQQTRGVIESRKEMIRGTQIIDNQQLNITRMHQEINQREAQMFEMGIQGRQMPFEPMNNNFVNINQNSTHVIPDQKESFKQNIKHMSTGEQRILNGLSQHIQDITNKYKNLGKNQYIQFTFEPIDKLLNTIDGDPEENKESLDNLKPNGLYYLPQPIIKKKKVSFWKRLTVFLLGVAQIILGAIIVASTAGALTSFGITAMMEGAKYCFDSIFRPQQLENLSKYFSKTAITYAFALAASGLEGIKQLGSLSQKGFKLMRQMPLGTFVKTMMKNVGVGFEKVATNYLMDVKGAGTHLISSGLSNLLVQKQNDLRNMVSDPVRRVIAASQTIKKQIDQKQKKQQSQGDKQYENSRQKFAEQITKQIKNLITSEQNNSLQQIKNLPLNQSILSQLISSALMEHFQLPTSGPKLRQLMDKLKSKEGVQALKVFEKATNFKQEIVACLRNLHQNPKFDLWISEALAKLVRESLNKVIEAKKVSINSQKTSLQQLASSINNNLSRPASLHNADVASYNQKQQQFNSDVDVYNQFVTKLDGKEIMELLKNRKAIMKNGRLNSRIIQQLPIHKYTKQALLNLQYKGSQDTFVEIVEAAIFNVIGNYGLKLMDRIFYENGGSQEKLAEFTKLIRP